MSDTYTPTQALILDVLGARYRLGEQVWTFSSRLLPQMRGLEDAGLIWGIGQDGPYVRTSLTEAGKRLVLNAATTQRLARQDAPDQPDAEATLRLLADTHGPWNLLMTAPVECLTDGRLALMWAMGRIGHVLDAQPAPDQKEHDR